MNLSFADLANAIVAGYDGHDGAFASRVAFWVDFFGDRDITSLTTDDIEDGIDALIKRGKIKISTTKAGVKRETSPKPLATSTVNRYVASLGTTFKQLKKRRLLPRGFVSPMRGVTRLEEGEGRTLAVTIDDVKRLIACCRISRNPYLAAITAMACTTGWRRGTLVGLKWGQLNLKEGFADTPRTKNGTPHRTPLLPWVIEELKRIKPDNPKDGDFVFGQQDFDTAWKRAVERANLPPWTFHHCRHIAASILAQSGASVVTIMQALNHKTPMMAMRYSHLNTDSLRESLGRAWA